MPKKPPIARKPGRDEVPTIDHIVEGYNVYHARAITNLVSTLTFKNGFKPDGTKITPPTPKEKEAAAFAILDLTQKWVEMELTDTLPDGCEGVVKKFKRAHPIAIKHIAHVMLPSNSTFAQRQRVSQRYLKYHHSWLSLDNMHGNTGLRKREEEAAKSAKQFKRIS